MISDDLEKDFLKNPMGELSEGIKEIVEMYKKRSKEVSYLLKRLENLIALVNLSESNIPKELVKNWIDETLDELSKMENINPNRFKKENAK